MCFVDVGEGLAVFAGARFTLYRAIEGRIEEIKGNRAGLGYRRLAPETTFGDVPIELRPDEAWYLITDGCG